METVTEGARERRRAGRGAERGAKAPKAPQPRLPFAPVELATPEQIERIHQASLKVLEEIGIEVLHDGARVILKKAGAIVDESTQRVRFPRDLVESKIGLAPKSFILHARNPENNVVIGENAVAFGSVASAPNVADRDGSRRPGNHKDYQNLLRLGQSLDAVHFWGGYPVEPADIHASVRHLDALYDMLTLSDKPIHAYSLGAERNLDAIELVRIAREIGRAHV